MKQEIKRICIWGSMGLMLWCGVHAMPLNAIGASEEPRTNVAETTTAGKTNTSTRKQVTSSRRVHGRRPDEAVASASKSADNNTKVEVNQDAVTADRIPPKEATPRQRGMNAKNNRGDVKNHRQAEHAKEVNTTTESRAEYSGLVNPETGLPSKSSGTPPRRRRHQNSKTPNAVVRTDNDTNRGVKSANNDMHRRGSTVGAKAANSPRRSGPNNDTAPKSQVHTMSNRHDRMNGESAATVETEMRDTVVPEMHRREPMHQMPERRRDHEVRHPGNNDSMAPRGPDGISNHDGRVRPMPHEGGRRMDTGDTMPNGTPQHQPRVQPYYNGEGDSAQSLQPKDIEYDRHVPVSEHPHNVREPIHSGRETLQEHNLQHPISAEPMPIDDANMSPAYPYNGENNSTSADPDIISANDLAPIVVSSVMSKLPALLAGVALQPQGVMAAIMPSTGFNHYAISSVDLLRPGTDRPEENVEPIVSTVPERERYYYHEVNSGCGNRPQMMPAEMHGGGRWIEVRQGEGPLPEPMGPRGMQPENPVEQPRMSPEAQRRLMLSRMEAMRRADGMNNGRRPTRKELRRMGVRDCELDGDASDCPDYGDNWESHQGYYRHMGPGGYPEGMGHRMYGTREEMGWKGDNLEPLPEAMMRGRGYHYGPRNFEMRGPDVMEDFYEEGYYRNRDLRAKNNQSQGAERANIVVEQLKEVMQARIDGCRQETDKKRRNDCLQRISVELDDQESYLMQQEKYINRLHNTNRQLRHALYK